MGHLKPAGSQDRFPCCPVTSPELSIKHPGIRRRRRRPRSAASETAILEATLNILYKEGYSALTLDRAAAKARVSKSTIYRRWPTKEYLILAVMEQLPMVAIPEVRI